VTELEFGVWCMSSWSDGNEVAGVAFNAYAEAIIIH
jgi:hypothetical protein